MQIDSAIQTICASLKKIKWMPYTDNIEWYYAESSTYVVHNTKDDAYYFVKAKSPTNACEHVIGLIGD